MVHLGASAGAVGGAGAAGTAGVPTIAVGTAGAGAVGTIPGTLLGITTVGAGEAGMAAGPHGDPHTSMVEIGTWATHANPSSMRTIAPQLTADLADVATTSVSLTTAPPSVAHLTTLTTALQ